MKFRCIHRLRRRCAGKEELKNTQRELPEFYLPLDNINIRSVFLNANMLETDVRNLFVRAHSREKDEMEKAMKLGFKAKRYYEEDVDEWVANNKEIDAYGLLEMKIPGIVKKLDKLDKKIISVMKEIQEVFPDAQYYTAGGGFNVVLGATHDDSTSDLEPQQQRSAWGGRAVIGDGDW